MNVPKLTPHTLTIDHPVFLNLAIALFLLVLPFSNLQAQTRFQTPEWGLLQDPGKLIKANASMRTVDGWTHFYNEEANILLVSIKLGDQEIGSLDEQLVISSGLLGNYGKVANDLSGASYVDQSIWLTMNRYWRIEKATPIQRPVRMRFYYSTQDYNDLIKGLDDIGLEDKQRGELLFFALTGNAVHPFSSRPDAMRAKYVPLRDSLKAETVPWRSDLYFAEFELNDLNAGGSGGFLIPVDQDVKSVSGRILRPDGTPVEGVLFASTIEGASVRTDDQGYYALANIPPGRDFEIKPKFEGSPQENLSVLDLIAMETRLESGVPFEEPWQELAADIDRSGKVDSKDLELVRSLVLGQNELPGNPIWRFIPANMAWPEGQNPLRKATPESILVDNLISDREDIDFIAIKGGDVWQEANFPNDPPVLLDAGFSINEKESCGGHEDILVDLSVSGFDEVMGFQFSLAWDPEILEFIDGQNFDLPGFDNNSLRAGSVNPGMLSVAWYTLKGSRRTRLQDGTVICQLRFRARGTYDGFSDIRFVNHPTPIQVLRKNLSTSNILFTAGRVNIKWETGIDTFFTDIKSVSCFSNEDGAIDLSIRGNRAPYQFNWNTGATTEDIRNLIPGVYSVTVSSQSKCPLVLDSLVVEEPRVLFLHNENVRQIQCPSGSDGAISFKTSGGSPPYTFRWSNGAATPWIGNLEEGHYKVTISDTNGCSTVQEFDILPPNPLYINYGISPATGPLEDDGTISISDLIGSTPPQQFIWSNGLTGPIVEKLPPGNYEVSVSDAMLCNYLLKFEIGVEEKPNTMEAILESTDIQKGSQQLVTIISPKDQTVQMRFFDSGSRMTWQKIVPLRRGKNYLYFTAPDTTGSYLMQIQPRMGSVSSVRFRVID
ncbi:MAG: hypothetical protein KDC34_08890 [Saprospiraceae bacterium]|nr:hypothetical protein [Saprospiraceae bacterium]